MAALRSILLSCKGMHIALQLTQRCALSASVSLRLWLAGKVQGVTLQSAELLLCQSCADSIVVLSKLQHCDMNDRLQICADVERSCRVLSMQAAPFVSELMSPWSLSWQPG